GGEAGGRSGGGSGPAGMPARPVRRSAGAGTVRVSVRADPGRRGRVRVSSTSGPRGPRWAVDVLREDGMAISGVERIQDRQLTQCAGGSPTHPPAGARSAIAGPAPPRARAALRIAQAAPAAA